MNKIKVKSSFFKNNTVLLLHNNNIIVTINYLLATIIFVKNKKIENRIKLQFRIIYILHLCLNSFSP